MSNKPVFIVSHSANLIGSTAIKAAVIVIAILTLGVLGTARASGIPSASGTVTLISTSGLDTFSITLQNLSPSISIETFWFGWVPGKDFLDSVPSNVVTPTGWTDTVQHGGSGDGWSIEFTTSTNPLAGSTTLPGFSFQTADTFSQMAGNSVFYSGSACTTSEVTTLTNDGGNSSNPFVLAVTVPEPGALAFFGIGTIGFFAWKKRRG